MFGWTLPRALKLDSLIGRSAALLVLVLTLATILSFLTFNFFVIRPQAERIADMLAQALSAVALTVNELKANEQKVFLRRLSTSPALRFHLDGEVPPASRGYPSLLETAFMRALQKRLKDQPEFQWRRDEKGRIWLAMTMAGQRYWISADPPTGLRPDLAFLFAVGAIAVLVLFLGIVVQRRIAQPLLSLSKAAAEVSLIDVPKPIRLDATIEIQDLADSFNRMTARLAAAEQERGIMLAGMSHDLRSPLAKIRLASEMISDNDVELRGIINRQVETMDAMLSQFLDFARGHDLEVPQRYDLGAIVGAAHLAIGDQAFACVIEDGITVKVRKEAFTRALTNLIQNAKNYGAEPFALEAGVLGTMAYVRVKDAGPGIPAAERDKLIQPFARGDSARGGPTGTGLGLAIANRAVQADGGRLVLSDAPGGGLWATLLVPLA